MKESLQCFDSALLSFPLNQKLFVRLLVFIVDTLYHGTWIDCSVKMHDRLYFVLFIHYLIS